MKPNSSYIFSIALSFLFSLAISCTKDSPNSSSVTSVCNNCRQPAPPTISFQIRDSSWTRLEGGEYISHLNDLIRASVDTIKHIYNVYVAGQANGLMQVPLNSQVNYYSGKISMSNTKGENNLIYYSKSVSYYGQLVYEPIPFASVDVTVEMEK